MRIPTQLVLSALLDDPTRELYGLEIDPRDMGRPARRYYRLTGGGVVAAKHALAEAYRPSRIGRPIPVIGAP